MERLKEEFKKEIVKIFGHRLNDGKCNFCGATIQNGEFCECNEARKINRYFKKAIKKVNYFNEQIAFATEFSSVKKELSRQCKIPTLFEGCNFEDYKTENDSEKKVKQAVFNYFNSAVENYFKGINLILVGGYGTGKTLLEVILCNELINKWAFSCKFINAVDLKGEITKCFDSKSKRTVDEVVNQYKKVDFLFLDDIDKLNPTEYVREFIYSLVNFRIERQLPIITSANHNLEELDSKFYGEAIVSRLINNSPVINFTHKNRRFQ